MLLRRGGAAEDDAASTESGVAGPAWRPPKRRRALAERTLRVGALALGLCGLSVARILWTPVRGSHLSLRQRLGDAYWVLAGWWWQQHRRFGAGGAALGGRARPVNATAARLECAAQNPGLVLHLKVPKAASTTVFDLARSLAPRNGYAVNSRPVYIDEADAAASAREYVDYYAGLPQRTLRTAHGAFLDFAAAGRPRPAYFGLMREPLSRLRSHYDYLHWGPRSRWAVFWKGHDGNAPPFDQCAADYFREAGAGLRRLRRRRRRGRRLGAAHGNNNNPNKGRCLYWANVQLAYFCGVGPTCRGREALEPGARFYAYGSAAALEAARAHIASDFVAVGLVSDLDGSFRLLERVLPTYFRGLVQAYRSKNVWSRATAAGPPTAAAAKDPPPPSVANTSAVDAKAVEAYIRDQVLAWEYKLYDHVREVFHAHLRACGLYKPDPTPPSGPGT